MPNEPGKNHYRRYPIKPLALGINDAVNPALLQDGQTPDCENVDFDAESVAGHGGAIKFNNQPAPHAGILTRTTGAPLYIAPGKSVPQRGYAFLPYSPDTDIGGDFAITGSGIAAHKFNARRGRSFSMSVSFALPADEKLYDVRKGAGAPAVKAADVDSLDEALEECTLIAQKGGDGYSPLSWAIGIVNTGDQFENVTGAAAFDRVSNYAIVFMWYDAPGWGGYSCGSMRYLVGAGGANVGSTGRYCTMGLRAIIAKAFIEPGREYHVAVNLSLDTGTPGSNVADPTAAWNQNGTFEIVLRDQLGNTTRCATHNTDLFSWKGPADNYDYLTRYGVRFSGRDPMFLGLGMRFAPWAGLGFAPLGLDSAALESGGHAMVDVSAIAIPTAYGALQTCTATLTDAYTVISLRGMHNADPANLPHPTNPDHATGAEPWPGLFDAVAVAVPNQGTAGVSEALRNCWLTFFGSPGGTQPAAVRGARIRIQDYLEVGASYRFTRASGTWSATSWATNATFFVTVFRWHQRPLRLSNFRIWSSSRDYTSPRTLFSLSSYSLLDDQTEPNLNNLVACWPLDDAGGGALRETVKGLTGYLAPYSMGKTDGGLFLSGEGEALVLDFSDDTVLTRQMESMLRTGRSGFAIEIGCTIPQAYYARQTADAGLTEREGVGAPTLVSWELKGDEPGTTDTPRPLLMLSHRARFAYAIGLEPFYYPCGFSVEVDALGDSTAGDTTVACPAWIAGPTAQWSTSAPWVGQRVRIQVGVQPSRVTEDSYTVYIAATPKSAFLPASGDASNSELAYYATVSIPRRDLARTVVTIGGGWRPGSQGYTELNARMIVDDVRVFGVAAPGALPSSSGGSISDGTGKLGGARSLPTGELSKADILNDIALDGGGANVTDGSVTITPATGANFFTAYPEASLEAVRETFVLVRGDTLERWIDNTIPELLTQFYYVDTVSASGNSATLTDPYDGASMSNVYAASFRVIGYTSFNDEIGHVGLQTSLGSPFVAGTSQPEDAAITEEVFTNLAPTAAPWNVRVHSPGVPVSACLPIWERGVSVPRRNPVLGMTSHRGRLYAATRGSLYVADDRWRDSGPTDTLKRSLAFLGAPVGNESLAAPVQGDALTFASASGCEITLTRLQANWVYDAWVKLDDHAELQTVLWVGSRSSNPTLNVGSGAGTHKCHVWVRLANGYPELCIGSTATYDGVNRPRGGLFVARAAGRVRVGEWTHVRWFLEDATGGADIATPRCFVNGRTSSVTVLASESGISAGAWISLANMVTASGCSVIVGAARDSFEAIPTSGVYTAGAASYGDILRPSRYHGYLHPLDGALAQLVAVQGQTSSQFDPHTLSYAGTAFSTLMSPEGVGHKAYDSGGAQYGLIESHPAISLMHEMGTHENPASWALYGAALFVTTGGRPIYVQG